MLRNGSETFDSWKKPPLPVYTQFYFFNVTNPEEILNGETPWLEDVGPYTYRELRNKDEIQFGDNGTTISAVSNKAYVFERDKSVGDPKIDLLRTINILALTAMEWSQLPLLRELIKALLKAYRQKLFVTHRVDELLWGYKDEILSLISVFKHDVSPYFGLFYGVSRFFFSETVCSAEEEGIASQIISSLWVNYLALLISCRVCEK